MKGFVKLGDKYVQFKTCAFGNTRNTYIYQEIKLYDNKDELDKLDCISQRMLDLYKNNFKIFLDGKMIDPNLLTLEVE